MTPQPVARAQVDGNRQGGSQNPSDNDEVVVPTQSSNNKSSTYEPGDEEEGAHHQGGDGNGKHSGASIWNGSRVDRVGLVVHIDKWTMPQHRVPVASMSLGIGR